MAVQTFTQEIDENWGMLTDGTQHASLQVFVDAVRVVTTDSVAMPPADAEGFVLDVGLWNITPPTIAWVRAHNTYSRIVFTVE
jgi:hypothetical protein